MSNFNSGMCVLHSDGFDNVRAITLLRPEDFQRYDMPFGHHA